MPATSTRNENALYEALILERYGRTLDELLQEQTRRPLPELLKEQQRRPRVPPVPVRQQPKPDSDAAAHYAALLEATAPRPRRSAA
ncbi:hypothetical protein [Streptomyces roseochromogenus]|uniref:Uncharacterized protein n=1 Tax=Streptomyces roseochromogenus subsp. oscitans DS 12.976 TaxID=1352936 RepID=V6K6F1_STRRC|nr:hypothetical protein [Streptomyces roseochromogenus]EST26991.1 hypothetical protein M878_26215 [Streptomyces roseochromogenus subsp. oscitans DS 12.976]